MKTFIDAAKPGFVKLNDAVTKGRTRAHGPATGLHQLDAMTHFLPGSLTMIAGRPGTGKTALGVTIARHASQPEPKQPDDDGLKYVPFVGSPVLFISPAESGEHVAQRLVTSEANVPLDRYTTGLLGPKEWEALTLAAVALGERRICIEDAPYASVESCERAVGSFLSAVADCGLDRPIVILDYVQLLRSEPRRQNRYEELCDTSRDLKAIARTHDVALVVVSQLNRNVEERGGLPRLSDLRDSGTLEDDADVVLFTCPKPNESETEGILVAKNRHGAIGYLRAHFKRGRARWENLTPDEDEP